MARTTDEQTLVTSAAPDTGAARRRDGRLVKSVVRALAMLEKLRDEPAGMSATSLAASVELTPASTYQLLRTLERFEYVRRDESTKRYFLGEATARLTLAFRSELGLIQIAAPHLYRLHESGGEDVHLSVWRHGEPAEIMVLRSYQTIVLNPAIDRSAPLVERLHCTATGKVYLANLPESEAVALLTRSGMTCRTPKTIQSIEALLPELARARERDYAQSDEEQALGMFGMAMPVRDYVARVVAVVSLGVPVERAHEANRERLLRLLRQATEGISERLGYDPRVHPDRAVWHSDRRKEGGTGPEPDLVRITSR